MCNMLGIIFKNAMRNNAYLVNDSINYKNIFISVQNIFHRVYTVNQKKQLVYQRNVYYIPKTFCIVLG